jgi:hypothetical protein
VLSVILAVLVIIAVINAYGIGYMVAMKRSVREQKIGRDLSERVSFAFSNLRDILSYKIDDIMERLEERREAKREPEEDSANMNFYN